MSIKISPYILVAVFLSILSVSCRNEERSEDIEDTSLEEEGVEGLNCIDPELLALIEEIEGVHGMDVVVEFFQYKGRNYIDIVSAYYPGEDSSMDGYFYIGENRVVFRNIDSCSANLLSDCVFESESMVEVSPPPHEPSQYSYVIDENEEIILITSIYHGGTGRLVINNGYIDTIFYRKPWPEIYPPAPIYEEIYERDTSEILDVAEVSPEFPGGMQEMYSYLGATIKYPQLAQDQNIQGKVYVQFVVEKDGSITDVNVIKGAHTLLDKEAVRVISGMPNWSPGMQEGRIVRVRYTIPINFTIN